MTLLAGGKLSGNRYLKSLLLCCEIYRRGKVHAQCIKCVLVREVHFVRNQGGEFVRIQPGEIVRQIVFLLTDRYYCQMIEIKSVPFIRHILFFLILICNPA